jgi:hypothetical protein
MLKIGVVRWRGKCSKHPTFDPFADGPGAVRGGCERCIALLEIHTHHQRMMALMKGFSPPMQKKSATQRAFDDAQASLF